MELTVRLDQVDDACLDVGPDRVVLQVGHVGHRHLHGQVERLGRRRSDDRRRRLAGQEPRHLLGRTHGRRQPDALRGLLQQSASRRSSDSARCAPRLVAATAWTSSTMTVCTPARVSRAAEVSIRNSDSGVVIRMSGGLVISSRRRAGGVSPERTPTLMLGRGQARALGDAGDAGQRCAQVALDVDGQRLERRHVEHAGARAGRARRRLGAAAGQPVDGPQERRQRLARPGRRDDQRVVAVGDGGPGVGLRAVGAANVPVNHSRVSVLNRASGSWVEPPDHRANEHRQTRPVEVSGGVRQICRCRGWGHTWEEACPSVARWTSSSAQTG